MTLFPGIGESFVPMRVRLLFALLISLLVYPILTPQIPPVPQSIAELAKLVAMEALVGLFFGSLLRLLLGTVETTGAILSVQIGLSNAMILNPALASQSALPGAFLVMAAVTLLFVTGLDHMLLRGMIDTYAVFPPGVALPPGDVVQSYTHLTSQSFAVGVEIAAPFLIIGLLLYVVVGFIQRLMPQVQLFMVMLPVEIAGGLFLFAATVGVMLSVWSRYFDEAVGDFLAR